MELDRLVQVAVGWAVSPGVDQAEVKWEVLRVWDQEDFANVRIAGRKCRIKSGSPVMNLSAHSAARLWQEPNKGKRWKKYAGYRWNRPNGFWSHDGKRSWNVYYPGKCAKIWFLEQSWD
jgi:hypothetical protein